MELLGTEAWTLVVNHPHDYLSFVLLAYEDEFTRSCAVEKDPNEKIYSNSISALSSVELLRRLILHREIPEDMRYPGVSWEDVMDILYGAGEQSLAFPGQLWVMSNLKPYIFLFATKNVLSCVFSFCNPTVSYFLYVVLNYQGRYDC